MPMVTYGIYGTYGTIWYIRYHMVWYGMVRYGTIWYGMVWYHMVYTVPYGICGIYGTYGNLWYIWPLSVITYGKTFADLKHDANLCGTLYGILCGSLSFMCPEYFLSKSRLTDDWNLIKLNFNSKPYRQWLYFNLC